MRTRFRHFSQFVFLPVLYELLEGQDTLNFQQNLAYVLEAAKMSPEFGKRLNHSYELVCW